MHWRNMRSDDLPHVWHVAEAVHVDYAETPEVLFQALSFRLSDSRKRSG